MFQVLAIYVSEKKGDPMRSVMSARAVAGRGIESDRYETGEGAYSRSKVGLRDATIFSQEGLDAANHHPAVVTPFEASDTRRNILVSGGPENLCELVGKRILIGGAVFQFTEECDPCQRPSNLSGKPGFQAAFAENGCGGIRTAILEGGEFKVGDEIRITEG